MRQTPLKTEGLFEIIIHQLKLVENTISGNLRHSIEIFRKGCILTKIFGSL